MSIRTRETLNKFADDINKRLAASAVSNGKEAPAPLSTKDAVERNLTAAFAKFQNFMDETHSEDEINIALVPVRTAISVINDEIRRERLEAMAKMPYRDAFLDYLRTQCVTGYSLSKNKDGDFVLDSDASVPLDAYDFISTLCSADLNGIIDACCIFADNVARYAISDSAVVSKNSMHQTYIDLRDRKGWNIPKSKLSLNALAKQMTEIAQMISCGVAPRMQSTDVTYVMHSIIQSKDVADSAGKFVKRDERTVVRFMFRALYTRYNKLAYEFQDTTRSAKGALGVKNNKAMGEPPIEDNVTPDAGEVHVSVAPKAEEKSVKKTTKKSVKAEEKPAETEEEKLIADIMAAAQA